VQKILPLLADRNGSSPAFDVVAPSLPNFGFSQGVSKRGFGLAQYAETCHKLMLQLGYDEYVTQSGDWGFWIARAIGKLYPESCKASHINMIYARAPSFSKHPLLALQSSLLPYSETEKRAKERREWFDKEGMGEISSHAKLLGCITDTRAGYNVLQSTKPQTLAYGLQDSPVALLSWIYEKLHDWTDAYPWTDDEILTWISIYYFSRAGPGAPQRIYYETVHTAADKDSTHKLCTYNSVIDYNGDVKLGLAYNPKELEIMPKTWGRTLGNVVYEVDNEQGG
jgi:hypothetical protein